MQMTHHTQGLSTKLSTTHKALLKTSVASVALLMMMAPVAGAQITIADGQTTTVFDPNGDSVTAAEGVTQTISDTTSDDDPDNGNIVLDGSNNDGTVITNSGTLINLDTQDENTVIFIDNGEDDVVINNTETGIMRGVNGVIFHEGDAVTITNAGVIEGTGAAEEGVVYFDRDNDSNVNTLTNTGTISSVGGGAIVVDTLLGSIGGTNPQSATEGSIPTFNGSANLVLNNSGTISNSATSGEAEAILFDGAPGNTSEGSLEIDKPEELAMFDFPAGTTEFEASLDSDSDVSPRRCRENVTGFEAQQINCLVGVTITNSGSITSAGAAAITNRSDAALNGNITNSGTTGIIRGTTAGIQISGAHVEHDLTITNSGTIDATAGSGLIITGDGVNLVNQTGGVISGTASGLLVTGSTFTTEEIGRGPLNNQNIFENVNGFAEPIVTSVIDTVTGINNSFVNAGTISGGTASVDLSGAGEAVTFEQQGGALTGDFLGSTGFADTLNFTTADFKLTDDILQNVNVNVASGVDIDIDGVRTINGALDVASGGELSFDLGANAQDQLIVQGNVVLADGSTVSVTDLGAVTAAGQSFTLIDATGSLVNGATLVEDSSFLLNFAVVTDDGNLVVVSENATTPTPTPPPDPTPTPTPLPQLEDIFTNSNSANLEEFGKDVINAFNGVENVSALNADIYTALAALETQAEVEEAVARLMPDLSRSAITEAFESVGGIANIINSRLGNIARSAALYAPANQYAAAGNLLTDASGNMYGGAESGVWSQVSYRNANQNGQGSLVGVSTGYEANTVSFAVGYDHALNNDALVGLSGSYSTSEVDADRSAGNSTELELLQVSAYGAYRIGAINISGQAGYAFGDAASQRTGVTASDLVNASYDIDGFNAQAQASYDFDLGEGSYISPLIGLRFGSFSNDDYTETGGLGLTVEGASRDYSEGSIGFVGGDRREFSNSVADLFVRVAYVTDFGDSLETVDVAFADQTTALTTAESDDQRIDFGLGANWYTNENLAVGVALDAEAGETYSSIGGNVRLKYNF